MKPHLFLGVEIQEEILQRIQPLVPADDELLITKLKNFLEEELGGILCQDHINLPHFTTLYSKNRWVVRISTCCLNHLHLLENRLNDVFRS